MIAVALKRVAGDFGFEASDTAGHIIRTDSSDESGGANYGTRPMQLLLMALGSCSGIDVVTILNKQKQTIDSFEMKVIGEREKGKTPSLWKTIHIEFSLTGTIDMDKAKRACQLSIEKYCSVAETLRRAGATLTWEVKLNG